MATHLAFDLGADSGRAILGRLNCGKLAIEEIHRFPTGIFSINGHLCWNIYRMFEEMKKALAICAGICTPDSIGIDTWGVDFGLIDEGGELIGLPYSYRDCRTAGAMESYFKKVKKEEVYRRTGIQFMEFNTIFQLESLARGKSPSISQADRILFIPDIFNYFLCGRKTTEFTFATTSQLYNPLEGGWDLELISALGIRSSLFQDIVKPGTVIGSLSNQISKETGIPEIPVIAVASHDTASAVAAVPASGRNWAYISSGTWSLMGIESETPIISDASYRANFTNEGGVDGRWRVLKNIAGMWLLQECRRSWTTDGQPPEYDALIDEASNAGKFLALINPDHQGFKTPPDMVMAISEFCRETGQNIPEKRAQVTRMILEGLALKYRYVLEQLKNISPEPIKTIHIIGGGSRNALLCRFTADATGLDVVAGPVEATAIGNILMQSLALGDVGSLDELRKVVGDSFDTNRYEPSGDCIAWNEAYSRFKKLLPEGR